MNDRELLEMAAKAEGIKGEIVETLGGWPAIRRSKEFQPWQPLNDDGDALRLAAILNIAIRYSSSFPHNDGGGSVYAKVYVGPSYAVNGGTVEVNHSFARTVHKYRLLESEAEFAEYMQRPERLEERWLASEAEALRRVIVRAAAEIGKGIIQQVNNDLPEDNYYKTEAESIAFAAAEIGKAK